MWRQRELVLKPRPRGIHLVTDEVVGQLDLSSVKVGLLHLFIQHTSASLSLGENASPEVRSDLERFLRQAVPDDTPYFEHAWEGPDDMPAHVKVALLGSSLSVPVTEGRLNLGAWQGIYLCEHREDGGARHLVATVFGE